MAASRLRRLRTILKDPRWLPFYAQRLFHGPALRRGVARGIARLRPAPPINPNGLMEADVRSLERDGLTRLGPLLAPDQAAAARTHLAGCRVSDDYRPGVPAFLPEGRGRHPDSHVAFHDPVDIVAAPHLLALANDPTLLSLAGRFLGCRPTISYMAAWWSYPTKSGPQQAENFHRDRDDWRFLKLFVYLSDVTGRNGPHVYVTGSANDPRLAAIRRYDDAEIAAAFPADAVRTLCGEAGEAFLEDTTGLHKGMPPVEGSRLIFQVVYGLTPLPYAPRRPIARRAEIAGGERFDPRINRVYLAG